MREGKVRVCSWYRRVEGSRHKYVERLAAVATDSVYILKHCNLTRADLGLQDSPCVALLRFSSSSSTPSTSPPPLCFSQTLPTVKQSNQCLWLVVAVQHFLYFSLLGYNQEAHPLASTTRLAHMHAHTHTPRHLLMIQWVTMCLTCSV